jgi:hypothetical protein
LGQSVGQAIEQDAGGNELEEPPVSSYGELVGVILLID